LARVPTGEFGGSCSTEAELADELILAVPLTLQHGAVSSLLDHTGL
jgi:hypothetical protein